MKGRPGWALIGRRSALGARLMPGPARTIWRAGGILLLALASVAAGCSSTGPAPVDSRDGYGPVPEGYYRVRDGDTLDAIGLRTGINYKSLAKWNRLSPPYRIYSGKLLRVVPPGSGGRQTVGDEQIATAAVKSAAKADGRNVSKGKSARPASSTRARRNAESGLTWKWPLVGKVLQTYRRGDRTRQGIRIRGRAGQQVVAAEAGTVVYSGSGLKGYGNLIIVKHSDNFLSAYGFNSRLLVSEGQRVKRGQSVAEVGQSSGGKYLLHFEIRRKGTAVNPMRYLPRSG